MTNQTLTDILGQQFVSKGDLEELQSAMMQKVLSTTSGGGDLIPEVFDPEIISYVVNDTPFLLRLRGIGQVQSHRSKIVSNRVKVSGVSTTAIGEVDNVPEGTDSVYDKDTGNMTTYVTPVKISLMEQLGAQDVTDVMADEIRDSILDHYFTLNRDIIKGAGTSNTLTGLKTKITTNTTDMQGEELTSKFQVDELCQRVMKSGGSPTALLTTANVISQLEEILYPTIQQIPDLEMAFGYRVTQYAAPNGRKIPIIVDPSVPDTADQQELYVLTEPSIRLKQLLPPTQLPVPASFLGSSEVIASFDYLQVRGERFNGKMYNIGTKTGATEGG